MITPASIEDWFVFAVMLGSLETFALIGYRWVLSAEQSAPEDRPDAVACHGSSGSVGFAHERSADPRMGTTAPRANPVDARLVSERA